MEAELRSYVIVRHKISRIGDKTEPDETSSTPRLNKEQNRTVTSRFQPEEEINKLNYESEHIAVRRYKCVVLVKTKSKLNIVCCSLYTKCGFHL